MVDENGFVNDPPADVLGTALRLAQLMKSNPDFLDRKAYDRGNELLAIFNNDEFGETPETQTFKRQVVTQKLEIIQQALDDMAARGKLLEKTYMGVCHSGKRTSTFLSPYGESPKGDVIFSIELVDPDMFLRWRKGSKDEITDEDVNAALYRLAAEWSKLL